MFLVLPYNSFAVDACVPNDSVAFIFSPDIYASYNSRIYDNSAATWSVFFSYGKVSGRSACLGSNYGVGYACTLKFDKPLVYTANGGALKENGNSVVGGETGGRECWCKITYPIYSLWGLTCAFNSAAECQSKCADNCAYWVGTGDFSEFRSALFDSVQN